MPEEPSGQDLRVPGWLIGLIVFAVLAVGGAATLIYRRPRPVPVVAGGPMPARAQRESSASQPATAPTPNLVPFEFSPRPASRPAAAPASTPSGTLGVSLAQARVGFANFDFVDETSAENEQICHGQYRFGPALLWYVGPAENLQYALVRVRLSPEHLRHLNVKESYEEIAAAPKGEFEAAMAGLGILVRFLDNIAPEWSDRKSLIDYATIRAAVEAKEKFPTKVHAAKRFELIWYAKEGELCVVVSPTALRPLGPGVMAERHQPE